MLPKPFLKEARAILQPNLLISAASGGGYMVWVIAGLIGVLVVAVVAVTVIYKRINVHIEDRDQLVNA